ncbi:MAG: VWA domain-containing protein [Candidatus Riflebacteria bacterium]|nr:VWA domain-containing protein [Candidatus Riflebacteria bacterium]
MKTWLGVMLAVLVAVGAVAVEAGAPVVASSPDRAFSPGGSSSDVASPPVVALSPAASSAAVGTAMPVAASSPIPALKPPFADWLAARLQKPATANLTARGLPPETPVTGEVGAWKIPVPEINPLGAQTLYTLGAGYREAGNLKLTFLDSGTEVQRVLNGESWALSFKTARGDVLPFLKEYAGRIGGEVFPAGGDDGFVFRVARPGAVWWADVDAHAADRVDLRVLRQRVLAVGEELKVTKDRFGRDGAFRFLAEVTGRKFLVLQVRLANGALVVRADNDTTTRDGTTLVRYQKYLTAAEYPEYTLYDFPQGPGLFEFTLARYGQTLPDEVTLRLVETASDLPGFRGGDGLGTLVVKNAPAGKVFATPQAFVDIRQHGRSLAGGVTRDGGAACGTDVTFRLPAGYYTVVNELTPEFREAKAQLIPVSAGETTVVRLPEGLTAANRALAAGDDDRELTGEITIDGKKDLGATAELALSVSDPRERDVFPTKENTVITESGVDTEIVDIRREVAPCSIALAVDSSGSMKKDMKATVAAVKAFLQGLPAGSFVQLIDFDGTVRELKGTTASEAVKNLSSLKAEGSTRLYDATAKAVGLVQGKSRPAVVVFTDGVDSREDQRGTGSSLTRAQAAKKVAEGKVPVFTIGFGKRLNADETLAAVDGAPDIGCLTEFAAISDGQYYPARDPEALRSVFAAIGSRLGNHFVITYRRPVENRAGDTPVVSLVIDNSGSMNSDPKKPNAKDGDFRMEKTKRMVREFVDRLPAGAVMQFTTFQGGGAKRIEVNRRQVATTDRVRLLKALGEMIADDGTPIVKALTAAFENLVPVSSRRKVIVFHTDSGLEVAPGQMADYQKILARIREQGIFVLWIGMGISTPDKEKVFAEAAKATGGEYVVSESVDEIAKKLEALLQRLQQPVAAKTVPLTVGIAYRTAQGETLRYRVQEQAEFSPPQQAGTPREPDVMTVETGGERVVAAVAAVPAPAAAAGGAVVEDADTVVAASTEIGRAMTNRAMELTLRRADFLDRLLGVEARRYGFQFVAVGMELKNCTEKNIPYVIPSIFQHFYLGLDGKGLFPASKATWLVERPVTRHGDPSIAIPAGGAVAGTMVFLVPAGREGFARQSLHFFDTAYGHIQMPIAGALPDAWRDLEKLPVTKPADVADGFALAVTATALEDRIDRYPAGDFARFRVIEGEFRSKVQALLNIDPARRIWLRFPSASGDLMVRLGDVTAFTPLGFRDPVQLAPGSTNVVRLVYDLPAALEGCGSELFFDLATGSAVIPVTEGKGVAAPAPVAEIDGELVKVRVNQLTQVPGGVSLADEVTSGTKTLLRGSVLLDVTFVDRPGKEGTLIPPDFFVLVDKGYKPGPKAVAGRIGLGGGGAGAGKGLGRPATANRGLIFGLDDRFGVFEGQARRAVVIFDDPGSDLKNWTLQSPYDEQIQVPVGKGEFATPELIAWRARVPEREPAFTSLLDGAVAAAVQRYRALDAGRPSDPVLGLERDDGFDDPVLPPIDTFGEAVLAGVTSERQFLGLMASITCLPKNAHDGRVQNADCSPAGVVTQGFGDIGATANLAVTVLSRLGRAPRLEPLAFTEAGARLLSDYHGIDVKREKSVPVGVSYDGDGGRRKTFVVPFLKDIGELTGLVYRPRDGGGLAQPPDSRTAVVSVFGVFEPGSDGTPGAGAADAGAALGGGGGARSAEVRMLQKTLRFDELGHEPIDLAFAPVSARGRTSYGVVLTTPGEVVVGEKALENPRRVTAIRVEIGGLDRPYTHTVDLAEGQTPDRLLITLGINLPDLPGPAATALEKAFRDAFAAVRKPEPFTAVRWHHRQLLYKVIAGQTAFDREMVPAGGLVLGRLRKPRCLVVVSERGDEGRLTTRIDLLQPFNEIHAGDEALRKAYFLLNGFFQSSLEAQVFPAGARMGYLDLWRNAPKGAEILAMPVDRGRDAWAKELAKAGTFPPRLVKAVKENRKVLFFPSKPTVMAGRERFAWLEMDPATGEVLSVLDNGCHGGSAEFSMLTTSLGEDTREFVKGTWIGINMAVWSVGSIALKTQDKGQILTEAKALALKIGAILAEFQDNLGKAKEYYDKIEELKEQAADAMEQIDSGGGGGGGDAGGDDGDDTDYGGKIKENLTKVFDQLPRVKIFGVDVNAKLKEGFRGFSNGYQTAVDVYFHAFGGSKKHVEVGKE